MAAPLSGFVRIALHAPAARVDLAVPGSVPLAALLPALLDRVGQQVQPGSPGWTLCRADGRPLDLAADLLTNDVVDGDVLVLQPAYAAVAPPVFDDVVDVIEGAGVSWTVRDRRRLGGVAFALAMLLGPAAGAVAAVAGPLRLPAAGVALLVVAPALGLLVTGYAPVAAAYAVVVVFGLLAGVLTVVVPADAARVAAVVGVFGLALTTALPPLALHLARVPRLRIGIDDERDEPGSDDAGQGHDVVPVHAAGRVAMARRLLTAMTAASLGVSVIACVLLAADAAGWSRALAAVLGLAIVLRARLYGVRPLVLATGVAGLAALLGTGVILLVTGHAPQVAVGCAVLAPCALLVAVGRSPDAPHARRLVDVVETLALLSVVPMVLGVWRVYAAVHRILG